MFQAIFQGVLLGLLLSVLIGPVFFLLIQTSITRGFKPALFLNIGVFCSDLFCVLVAHSFASLIAKQIHGHMEVYLVGGIALFVFGLFKFFKHKQDKKLSEVKETIPHLLILKGFFINIINPSLVMFWIGASTFAISTFENNTLIAAYFISALTVVITVDISKIYLAHSFKHTFTEKRMKYLNFVTASFLVIVGCYLVYIYLSSVIGEVVSQFFMSLFTTKHYTEVGTLYL